MNDFTNSFPNCQTGEIVSFDGTRLFTRSYKPTKPAKAVVLVVHGLAEHSGRYEHVAEFLTKAGFAFETFDLRGHGKSGGARIFVNSFDDYLRDLDLIMSEVKRNYPDLPIFLLGHSMGGAITSLFTITRKSPIAGLILSAPSLKISDSISPFLIKMAPLIGKLLPKLPTIVLDKNAISRDPMVVQKYDEDPLNYRGGIPARTGAELNLAIGRIQIQMEILDLPLLILQGTVDHLSDIRGSQMLFDLAKSKDKTFNRYEGFYHEILNDPEKMRVLDDIRDWMEKHYGVAK
ncbi:MAG: alpha/beta hydrolase [Candidatus Marinimicrobia bacterium CG08_land_8_20_14_0_20_45_22]|nr:MAG: alpha/beta hydrolase [Candidatus Marinimicrobia bacterium CG08_land_8_20_14_0_20_45_22]